MINSEQQVVSPIGPSEARIGIEEKPVQYALVIKRALDVIGSAVILILLSPFLTLLTLPRGGR